MASLVLVNEEGNFLMGCCIFIGGSVNIWAPSVLIVMLIVNMVAFTTLVYSLGIFSFSDLFSCGGFTSIVSINAVNDQVLSNFFSGLLLSDFFCLFCFIGLSDGLFFSIPCLLKPIFIDFDTQPRNSRKLRFLSFLLKYLLSFLLFVLCIAWLYYWGAFILLGFLTQVYISGMRNWCFTIVDALVSCYAYAEISYDFWIVDADPFTLDDHFSIVFSNAPKLVYSFFRSALGY